MEKPPLQLFQALRGCKLLHMIRSWHLRGAYQERHSMDGSRLKPGGALTLVSGGYLKVYFLKESSSKQCGWM